MRALTAIAGTPWLIQQEWLQLIWQIASREHLPDPEALQRQLARRHQALEMERAPRLDGARLTRLHPGRVARIPVVGPMFRYADLFTEISGAVATETIAREFRLAMDSEEVESIVLDIDSPGGEAAGIEELAEHVYLARGVKPVVAYVGGVGASGAYWIASAAERIVAAPTAILGSIGVVMVYRDTRERDRKQGIEEIEFVSSVSPNKRPDPQTDAGRAEIQRTVDDMAAVFVARVARNRGRSPAQVVEGYGRGGVMVGEVAVAAGMADGLGMLESLLAELAAPEEPEQLPGWPYRRLGVSGGGMKEIGSARAAGPEEQGMPEETQAAEQQGFIAGLRAAFSLGGAQPARLASAVLEPGESADTRQLRAERDQAVARADKAEAELGEVCAHFREQIRRASVTLGRPETEREARGADAMVEAREWKALAGDAEALQKQVFATIPAGTSADPKAATADPDGRPDYRAEAREVVARVRGKRPAATGNGNGGER